MNKCPYCDREFDTPWQMVNHVRISAGPHGKKYRMPEDFKLNVSTGENKPLDKPLEPNVSNDSNVSNVQGIDPPEKPVVTNQLCPDCETPKADWIAVSQAEEHDINLSAEERKEYDYICPKCMELMRVK